MKRKHLVPLAGVVIALALAVALARWSLDGFKLVTSPTVPPATRRLTSPSPELQPSAAEHRRRATERALVHLDRADDECRQAVADQIAALDEFFEAAKRRTPQFADRVLGWDGQWRLIADHVPLAGGGRFERHLRQAFRDCLFAPEQLEGEVRRAVTGYQFAVEGVEGETLVNVRADVADLTATPAAFTTDPRGFDQAFEGALGRAKGLAAAGLRADVAGELVAAALGEVLTRTAVRLGATAGVVGAAAAASPAAVGVGLATALVVDEALSRAWEWWADPRGGLARELGRELDAIRHALVEGTADTPGLRSRLTGADRRRAVARRAAVLGLLDGDGGAP